MNSFVNYMQEDSHKKSGIDLNPVSSYPFSFLILRKFTYKEIP